MSFYALPSPLSALQEPSSLLVVVGAARPAMMTFATRPLFMCGGNNDFCRAMAKRQRDNDNTSTTSATTSTTSTSTSTSTTSTATMDSSDNNNNSNTLQLEPRRVILVDFSPSTMEQANTSSSESSLTESTSSLCDDTNSNSCEELMKIHHDHQDLKITVKDAAIDFNQLVRPHRSRVTKYGYGSSAALLSRKERQSRLQQRQALPLGASSSSCQRQRQPLDSSSPPPPPTTSSRLDPYEKAINFELIVSYVGRVYSTKRTLQQIAQLRDDLLQELAVQQKWRERGLGRRLRQMLLLEGSAESLSLSLGLEDATSTTTVGSSSSSCFEDATSTPTTSSNSSCCIDDLHHHPRKSPIIPDLPRMQSEDTMGGYAGCGSFARMSMLLHAYRPALEEWFQTVIAIVSDDSPVLANFLWEPLSTQCIDPLHADLTTLGSIQEL